VWVHALEALGVGPGPQPPNPGPVMGFPGLLGLHVVPYDCLQLCAAEGVLVAHDVLVLEDPLVVAGRQLGQDLVHCII
jgi:hypothetical protein